MVRRPCATPAVPAAGCRDLWEAAEPEAIRAMLLEHSLYLLHGLWEAAAAHTVRVAAALSGRVGVNSRQKRGWDDMGWRQRRGWDDMGIAMGMAAHRARRSRRCRRTWRRRRSELWAGTSRSCTDSRRRRGAGPARPPAAPAAPRAPAAPAPAAASAARRAQRPAGAAAVGAGRRRSAGPAGRPRSRSAGGAGPGRRRSRP